MKRGATARSALSWLLPLASLWLSYGGLLGCASPDLTGTLFSCTTSADCAPGQQCLPFQGERACQLASSLPSGACADSSCSVPAVVTDEAPPLPAAPPEPAPLEPAPLDTPSTEGPRLDAPLAEPSESGGDESLGAAPGSSTLSGSADAGVALPSVRVDFESGLEGWQMAISQRPADALDTVEQSTALAHHGTGALRMVFNGNATPLPTAGFAPAPFYGVFEPGAPPPGVNVSLWMLSTAPGMSVEVYTQSGLAFTWTVLATVPLLPNEWRQITVAMPLEQARQFGIRLHSPLDFRGEVYLDELRW